MQVISVNRENTVSQKKIAFNVDEDLTPEFVKQIEYGNLKFSGQGRLLIVQIPVDGENFDSNSVDSLNTILSEVKTAIDEQRQKRDRMLNQISNATGLPLD